MPKQNPETNEFPALMLVESRRVAGEDAEVDSQLVRDMDFRLQEEIMSVSGRIIEILGEISITGLAGEQNSLLIDHEELDHLSARLYGLQAFMDLNRDFTQAPVIAEAS